MFKEFSAPGVAITDEISRCNEAVTINGTTFYRGYLANTCNQNIYGSDSPSYGVYSAASQGGTRYFVQIAGYPVSNQVSIDTKNGWVWSTTQATYYATYLAHQPIIHHPNGVSIDIPYVLTAGQSITIARLKFPYFAKFGYADINVEGGLPSSNATITVSNGTESQALTFSTNTNVIEFATPLKITTAETLTVSTTDGKGAYGLTVQLMDV